MLLAFYSSYLLAVSLLLLLLLFFAASTITSSWSVVLILTVDFLLGLAPSSSSVVMARVAVFTSVCQSKRRSSASGRVGSTDAEEGELLLASDVED